MNSPPLLEARVVVRRFPGVLALAGVDFSLDAGEVHVLFGENGAGKSTLIQILAGALKPSEGELRFRGEALHLASVHDARRRGISAVFQEFSLVAEMSVADNLVLGAEDTRFGLLDRSAMRRHAQAALDELGFALDPSRKVSELTRAEAQMVEIAKAMRDDLSVLILDEPTASLTDAETDQLFALVRRLTAKGVGVIYITHRIAEIAALGDRVSVLRDGEHVATVPASTPADELVSLMTGRAVGDIYPALPPAPDNGQTTLRAVELSSADGTVRNVSLEVGAGELVGLAGLVGSGKSEVLQACFGARAVASGHVFLGDEDVTGASSRKLLDKGFLYLPPDRRRQGLVMMRSVRENTSLAALHRAPFSRAGLLMRGTERRHARDVARNMQLSPPRIERAVQQFSGGNQQKVMLARALATEYRLIVFDEPTVGVDVGTRAAIYRFITELCEAGVAIVIVSSDLAEVLNLSHRLYVFSRGSVAAELAGADIDEANVLAHFFDRAA